MSLLQYTSDEMYSSTELIRKSKNIFDKLNNKEIEKAIILRDGKPSFMLLDFETYENLVKEYIKLKNSSSKIERAEPVKKQIIEKVQKVIPEKIIEENVLKEKETTKDEIDNEELERALREIENLEFNISAKDDQKQTKPLNDFWE